MIKQSIVDEYQQIKLPFEYQVYPECYAGMFSHRDCTVAFYSRIAALLNEGDVLLNVGAGRGANIKRDISAYRRKLQTFRGRVGKVVGLDVDDAIRENSDLDEYHVVDPVSRWPIQDASVNVIVCDHVMEHVENPANFATEIRRVLKPGGWYCARSPNKWGYIGIAARTVPNRLHTRTLKAVQPSRQAHDVFPTYCRINTLRAIKRHFTVDDWSHHSYGFNGVPGYHADKLLLFRMVEGWCWLMPRSLSAKLHVFLRRKNL